MEYGSDVWQNHASESLLGSGFYEPDSAFIQNNGYKSVVYSEENSIGQSFSASGIYNVNRRDMIMSRVSSLNFFYKQLHKMQPSNITVKDKSPSEIKRELDLLA